MSGFNFYQQLLESLWTALGELPTADFQYEAHDRFHQAREFDPVAGGVGHLECWLTLGQARFPKPQVEHEAVLHIVHRYTPDDDAQSQARVHAAARAVVAMLDQWVGPGAIRARVLSYDVQVLPRSRQWLLTPIRFDLRLPRS